MQKINNININDEISWVGGKNLDHLMSGIVVERVRAKSRPKHEKPSAGKTTKREISFITRCQGHLYWIDASQITPNRKKSATKAETAVKTPKIQPTAGSATKPKPKIRVAEPIAIEHPATPTFPRPEMMKVWPFKHDYSCLMKHLSTR